MALTCSTRRWGPDCWQDAAVLAGAVMQLLFWVGLLVHQRTAGRQPRPAEENGLQDPLLGEAGSAPQCLTIGTVRTFSCHKVLQDSLQMAVHIITNSFHNAQQRLVSRVTGSFITIGSVHGARCLRLNRQVYVLNWRLDVRRA